MTLLTTTYQSSTDTDIDVIVDFYMEDGQLVIEEVSDLQGVEMHLTAKDEESLAEKIFGELRN